MPNAMTHSVFGAVVAAVFCRFVFMPVNPFVDLWVFLLVFFSWVFIASQLPDVDHHAARVPVWVTFISLGWMAAFLQGGQIEKVWYLLIPLFVLWFLKAFKLLSHRGICHHGFFATFILPLPILLWFDWSWYVLGAVLSLGHVVLDKIKDKLWAKRRNKKDV